MPETSRPPGAPASWAHRGAALYRALVVVVLGFASGLPLALTGPALQAWLTTEGLDIAAIGFLSLAGLPYTFKFLWAPFMDRYELLGRWGRRRGWLVATQLMVALALLALAQMNPTANVQLFALVAVGLAFMAASQDVVLDAYRTDLLPAAERGIGSSLAVLGYRVAMIVSGGLALIWTDAQQGSGLTWPQVYRLMAGLMVGAALFSAVALPRLPQPDVRPPSDGMRGDLRGFAAVLAAVALGYVLTDQFGKAIAGTLLQPLLAHSALSPALQGRWVDLAALLLGLAFTLPLAGWAARAARFQTLLDGLASFFAQPQAGAILLLIVLYKLGDAFAAALMTPFLLKAVMFTGAEVGVVNKVMGLWLSIGGALLGGVLMLRLGLWRALILFGALQAASNLGFWWLAVTGKGALPSLLLPAFDWGFVKLAAPTTVDGGLLMVVALENLTGGMGTAAALAFTMSLCNQRFTATQFALLSAFASVGRVWVGPLAGVLAESIGWPSFFLISTVLGLPALLMLWAMRRPIRALEVPRGAALADD